MMFGTHPPTVEGFPRTAADARDVPMTAYSLSAFVADGIGNQGTAGRKKALAEASNARIASSDGDLAAYPPSANRYLHALRRTYRTAEANEYRKVVERGIRLSGAPIIGGLFR